MRLALSIVEPRFRNFVEAKKICGCHDILFRQQVSTILILHLAWPLENFRSASDAVTIIKKNLEALIAKTTTVNCDDDSRYAANTSSRYSFAAKKFRENAPLVDNTQWRSEKR